MMINFVKYLFGRKVIKLLLEVKDHNARGAAHEYVISEFADLAGKQGGEFYMPCIRIRLMVQGM